MKYKKRIYLLFVILPFLAGSLLLPMTDWNANLDGEPRLEILPTGETVEVGPDEVLFTYDISEGPTSVSGTGTALDASEYGERTDTFADERMNYDSGSQTTTTANLSVPLGDDWEGYKVVGNITSITENRTWVDNSGFDADTDWTYLTHDEPSIFSPTYTNTMTSEWRATGGNPSGNGYFWMDGYYHNAGDGLYGDWYDVGDKAYAVQNLTIDRGDVTSLGISVDYWADINWGILTGFFEVFVSLGDPDNGGTYLWQKSFDAMGTGSSATWMSSGYVDVDPSVLTLPQVNLWIGLRTTALEWWRGDVEPRARLDNLLIYVTAKATPEDVNLEMNGVTVDNVLDQGTPVFGLGTVTFTPTMPWQSGLAYANFSWTPSPNPPDPNFDINIDIDADVTVFARRYNVESVNDTELITRGDNYVVQNATDVLWEANHYTAVPTGYDSRYSFNVSTPINRDVYHVGEPYYRFVNLSSGWNQGDPGDGAVNVTAYQVAAVDLNGFWYLKSSSPNMITDLRVWDDTGGSWVQTLSFRANDDTRFDAVLSSAYENDIVTFIVYDSSGAVWTTIQAPVDSSGHAISSYVNFEATNSSVGFWEVQAFVVDEISGSGDIRNVGYFSRGYDIVHSTDMNVKYPVGSEVSWTVNVTYGDLFLLQFRVNDTDNGDLLAGGVMSYDWISGSGSVSDLGTGEYSRTFSTLGLSAGQYDIDLTWSKNYFDSIVRTFTVNVIYTTDLFSSDAPGVDVPRGFDAVMDLYYEDQTSSPITGAEIVCDWSFDNYDVTPVVGNPGHYSLRIETTAAPLGIYQVRINASKDYFETRSIVLSVQVRELHTSAIPSTSQLSLPVGYSTSFTITYTDTDHSLPLTGSAGSIQCNWSDIHQTGDENYTVIETGTPGVYDVTLFSEDLDILQIYEVAFTVNRYGAQNHTFIVTVELRTHLTSFYLVNPIDPTPYTGDFQVLVSYYDVDQLSGIENGSAVGYNVLITVDSPGLGSVLYSVSNSTTPGEYIISIPASQWGTTGSKSLIIYADWIGPTVKYSNEVITTNATVTGTPTDIFLGVSPIMTPYSENISFTVIYYDVGTGTGIVNSTGPYAGNVHLYVEVLTAGQALTPALIELTELDPFGQPGEYQFELDTDYLSGIIGCELRIWFNWTSGALPLYQNQTLLVTVYSTYRQTTVDWNPLPVTPYDELVNLSLTFRDVLTGSPILDSPTLTISIQEAITYTVLYDGDVTGVFMIELDTSSWSPGNHIFNIDVVWTGSPFYQNRTSIAIPITVRERYTDLTHGSYAPTQFGEDVVIIFTYRDLDDFTSVGMNGGSMTLDASLAAFSDVLDNGDGTYTLTLDTSGLGSIDSFLVNVSITYGGARFCADATDFFYITITERRTQLTSDLPDPAPYLSLASITVYYIDDESNQGVSGANVYVECDTSSQILVLDSNYFISSIVDGQYEITINTVALGNFGPYTIRVIVNYTGSPFYMERIRTVDIEVSRRPAEITVSNSPLNTPFGEDVQFEITITDILDSLGIDIDKSVLTLVYGGSVTLFDSQYSLTGASGTYTITIESSLMTSILIDELEIDIAFNWGDVAPYYSNSTTSTEVSIISRFTQGAVLSTPGAFYYSNASALLEYSDYLSSGPI
ncbi:MAG: hypothetical protein RTU92_11005, partial [Candidatus Thorarchaeota archaeon]